MPAQRLHLRRTPVYVPDPRMPPGTSARLGDEVTWTDPVTGARWHGLRVEFVHSMQRMLVVRGHFGRLSQRDSSEVVETRPVTMSQAEVTSRAGETE